MAEVYVPAPVSLVITPAKARLEPGKSLLLLPFVDGDGVDVYNCGVTWQLLQQGGGSVDTKGYYTAPATPGTYQVRAISKLDPSKSALATITVSDTPAATLRPFTPLPSHEGQVPKLHDASGEPRLMVDRSPGSKGELFGFVGDTLFLVKSSDKGASWSYVEPLGAEKIGYGVLAVAQDSKGKVHLLHRLDGRMLYSRIVLEHANGAINGFRSEVKDIYLPGVINAFIQVRGSMQTVIDGAGEERLLYQVNSYERENDARFCLRMGSAKSLTPSTTADFVGLDGGSSLTTVFQTAVYGIGGHAANFAQLGATREVWVFWGPTPEYGVWTDGSSNQRLLLTPKPDHNWSLGKAINIDLPNNLTRPCQFTVVGTQNYVWFMRSDVDKGISFDRIDRNGLYTKSVIPSPENYSNRGGQGVFSVSADETKVSAIWNTWSRYDTTNLPLPDRITTEAFWDGNAWTINNDTLSGVNDKSCAGYYGSTAWSEGLVAFYIANSDHSISVASVVAK
jgi:hypothetical protein